MRRPEWVLRSVEIYPQSRVDGFFNLTKAVKVLEEQDDLILLAVLYFDAREGVEFVRVIRS